MSDEPPDPIATAIESGLATDTRFAVFAQSVAVETELRDSQALKALQTAVWQDALQAMDELAEVSPTDADAVSLLLVRVKTQVYMRKWLRHILDRGKLAEVSITADRQIREANEWADDR